MTSVERQRSLPCILLASSAPNCSSGDVLSLPPHPFVRRGRALPSSLLLGRQRMAILTSLLERHRVAIRFLLQERVTILSLLLESQRLSGEARGLSIFSLILRFSSLVFSFLSSPKFFQRGPDPLSREARGEHPLSYSGDVEGNHPHPSHPSSGATEGGNRLLLSRRAEGGHLLPSPREAACCHPLSYYLQRQGVPIVSLFSSLLVSSSGDPLPLSRAVRNVTLSF